MPAPTQPASLPFTGKWKLKDVKSPSGVPPALLPREGTTVFSQEPDGIHLSAETIYTNGQKRTIDSTFRLDGSSYPVIGSLLADALNARQADDQTMEITMTQEGRVAGKVVGVLSDGGNLMTAKWDIIPAEGEPFSFTTVSAREK